MAAEAVIYWEAVIPMRLSKTSIALFLAASTMVMADMAWAHGSARHRHSGVGIFIGGPIFHRPFSPWYSPYRPPYFYYPPVVAVPVAPPPPTFYIEQASEAPPSQSYWYYCGSSKAYYPYVQQCPEAWQRVSPTPP